MRWISHYQLFLFDFDGLLVNTEELHYQAYLNMCAERGFKLNWSFFRYSEAAHHSSSALREQIYAELPELHQMEPNWSVLYEEKKEALLKLIHQGSAHLMPGVADLLQALNRANINRCVVTHSLNTLIHPIREQNPILNTIPHWVTREDYAIPKPDPECYRVAISRYAKEGDRIIGFEDSPRGFNALMGTRATPVLICPRDYPYLAKLLESKINYYPSFSDITDENNPFLV